MMGLHALNPKNLEAKKRQEAVLAFLAKYPDRTFTAMEIALELWKFGRRKLIESAIDRLRHDDRIDTVVQTHGGNQTTSCNRYRAKAAERKTA